MTADCAVKPPSTWEYRRSLHSLRTRQAAANEQMLCLTRKLEKTIAAFRASPGARDGIIVVHGDHGSRVTHHDPEQENKARLSKADLLAGYATLFAVRAPGIAPGIEKTPVAAPEVLGALTRNRFASVSGLKPGSGQIFLDGPEWQVGEQASLNHAWPRAL